MTAVRKKWDFVTIDSIVIILSKPISWTLDKSASDPLSLESEMGLKKPCNRDMAGVQMNNSPVWGEMQRIPNYRVIPRLVCEQRSILVYRRIAGQAPIE
jgi:hypothetical protein